MAAQGVDGSNAPAATMNGSDKRRKPVTAIGDGKLQWWRRRWEPAYARAILAMTAARTAPAVTAAVSDGDGFQLSEAGLAQVI